MSEHKTGVSNWSAEEKKLYRERREKGLRGSIGYVTVYQPVKDEQGNDQRIPIAERLLGTLSRGKSSARRAYKRHPEPVVARQQRKATARGK